MPVARVCLGCGVLTHGSRCPDCARRKDRERGTVTQRFGSGWAAISRAVIARDDHECQLGLPGCTFVATCVDHITPRSLGGDNDPANLRAACAFCNGSRGNRR